MEWIFEIKLLIFTCFFGVVWDKKRENIFFNLQKYRILWWRLNISFYICILGLKQKRIYVIINAKFFSYFSFIFVMRQQQRTLVWVENHNFCYPHKSSQKNEYKNTKISQPHIAHSSWEEKKKDFSNLNSMRFNNKQVFLGFLNSFDYFFFLFFSACWKKTRSRESSLKIILLLHDKRWHIKENLWILKWKSFSLFTHSLNWTFISSLLSMYIVVERWEHYDDYEKDKTLNSFLLLLLLSLIMDQYGTTRTLNYSNFFAQKIFNSHES